MMPAVTPRRCSATFIVTSLFLILFACQTETAAVSWPDDYIAYGQLHVFPDDGGTVPLLSRVWPIVGGLTETGTVGYFVLDTGAYLTAISPNDKVRLALKTRELATPFIVGTGDTLTFRDCAIIDRIKFGDVSATNLEALVVELPAELSGLVGLSLFGSLPLLFDAQRGEARFLPVDSLESVLNAQYPQRSWTRIPLRWERTALWIEVAAGDSNFKMFVDTGAGDTTIMPEAATEAGLKVTRKSKFLSHSVVG